MSTDFLVFGAPAIDEAEIQEVVETLRSGWLGTGPKVARFERAFADYKGVDPSCVAAVNSCTAALHVSMVAAGVGPGDEVIAPALTFCATVNAVIHAGATPVLADIDPTTMNINPAEVEARLTPRTKAVLPVHFAGRPCDMESLAATAERHGLLMIEDCAHSIETEYRGRKTGTFGDFGCFSFYVTKNVVTGEGGMVVAKDPSLIARIKQLALHGMSKDAWHRFGDHGFKHYFVVECGFKYNMMDIQASIGLHQLARVETNWRKRKALWDHYQQAFAGLPVTRPADLERDTRHAYHLYTLLVDESRTGVTRDAFLDSMQERRIGTGVHYLSLPEHPFYQQRFGWRPEEYPNAMRVGRQTVSLPLSAKLKDSQRDSVVSAVRSVLGH